MPKIDLEKERKRLDREITFFHFKRAKRHASRCLDLAIKTGDNFFFFYFKKALEIEPARVESLFSLADTYTYLGESMKAKEYFQKAIFQIRGKCTHIYKQILKRLKNIK